MAAAKGTAASAAAVTTRTALRRLAKGVVGRGVAARLGAREPGRPRDDGDEGEHAQHAERAVRQPLVEQRGTGDDRQGVRQERRHPGGRKGGAALEAELEGDEGEPVAREQRGDEREPAAERGAEEPESEQRGAHAGELSRRGPRSRRPPGQEGEEADSAGGGRLHERERRERERGDVEHPAADAGKEADEPAAVDEEDDERGNRAAEREPRQPAGRLVLGEVPPVERARRGERQREAAEERGGHPASASRSRAAKGRYASAASAAMPTRGRSRRRS